MRNKKNLYFLLPILILTSCGNGVSNNGSTSSVSSNNSSQYSNELTKEMLSELGKGFAADSLYSYGVSEQTLIKQYIETRSEPDCFEYKAWEETLTFDEKPNKDNLVESYRYEPNRGGSLAYLSLAQLTLNNEVEKYLLAASGSGSPILWNASGYGNPFADVEVSDFKKGSVENEYYLNIDDLSLSAIRDSISTVFSGIMGLTLTSFKLVVEEDKLTKYSLEFEPYNSIYGKTYTFIDGSFIEFGSSVLTPLKPIEGEKYAEFDEAMKALQNKNFDANISLSDKELKVSSDGNNVIYELYDSFGEKTGSYGYVQKSDGVVQGLTKIENNIYLDGVELAGEVTKILPTFLISSIFFDKSAESTDTKKIFTLKKDIDPSIPYYTDYGMMGNSSIVGELTVIIETNKITFENKLSLGTEKFVYTNIGVVDNLVANLKETCDNLTWSQLLSNQPNDLETLYEVVPQQLIDSVPTIGGTYSYITLDVEVDPTQPAIIIPIADYDAGVEVINTLSEKLNNANFDEDTNVRDDRNASFTLNTNYNNEDVTLQVTLYLAADYFYQPQVVIFINLI